MAAEEIYFILAAFYLVVQPGLEQVFQNSTVKGAGPVTNFFQVSTLDMGFHVAQACNIEGDGFLACFLFGHPHQEEQAFNGHVLQ